ncbi:MAG: DNA repair protein RadA [Magnetovibrio sp.]|nr:DNA repair protein RadA [Magnetovibrio sp.]
MARKSIIYICDECGVRHKKWAGQCSCGAWNTLSKEEGFESAPKGLSDGKGDRISFVGLKGKEEPAHRRVTKISEFDRVCGGGLVSGSATLVGGDPGIGKSTLLIQVVAALSKDFKCVYISGEEAIAQLRLRAARLGLDNAPVGLATTTSVRDIITTFDKEYLPDVAVIDSIQCMFVDNLDSAPGTVTQIRTSAQELIRIAKRRQFALILVGHVTKDGNIAGPRILEHMVDTVLYFEGEPSHQFRVLRSVKNRFGPTDEIGVFEMTETGLNEVSNPSALFLASYHDKVAGISVFAGIEGSRPLLIEIQSLIAPSQQPAPRRAVVGWDTNRLAMIMAVLGSRCGIPLSSNEVYLNVVGGLRIREPAADLAVAAALISSFLEKPVAKKTIVFGEVGLSGEIRAVSHIATRLKEAEKLGFTSAIIPIAGYENDGKHANQLNTSLTLKRISQLADLVATFEPLNSGVTND